MVERFIDENRADYLEQYWRGVYDQFGFDKGISPIPVSLVERPDFISTFHPDRTLIYVHPEFSFDHIAQLFSTRRIDEIIAVLLTEIWGFENLYEQHGWLLVESSREAPSEETTWTKMHRQFRQLNACGMTITTYAAFAVACRDSYSYPDADRLVGISGTTWKGRSIVAGFLDGALTFKPKPKRLIGNGRSAISLTGQDDPSAVQPHLT